MHNLLRCKKILCKYKYLHCWTHFLPNIIIIPFGNYVNPGYYCTNILFMSFNIHKVSKEVYIYTYIHFHVLYYFQPLSECERHTDIGNLCYVVQCGASEHTVCGDVFSTSFNLSKDEAYDCHIGAQSEVDSVTSQPPTSIHVPSTSQSKYTHMSCIVY